MTTQFNQLENVCKYLQRNDRNGDYLEMINEYNQGELDIEVIQDVCNRVLNEWKEDLETIEQPTQDDIKDINHLQQLIESIQQ